MFKVKNIILNIKKILHFSINQTTGELTLIGTVSPGGVQWNLVFL